MSTILLTQIKPVTDGQLEASVLICFQEHNIGALKADIKQAHANAKLGGVLDMSRVNEDEEGIEAAQAIIAENKQALARHKTKPLSCNSQWVIRTNQCIDDKLKNDSDANREERCRGEQMEKILDEIIAVENNWTWL